MSQIRSTYLASMTADEIRTNKMGEANLTAAEILDEADRIIADLNEQITTARRLNEWRAVEAYLKAKVPTHTPDGYRLSITDRLDLYAARCRDEGVRMRRKG